MAETTHIICDKPDRSGRFNPRCQHTIAKPKGEEDARQCRRAAEMGFQFCPAHIPDAVRRYATRDNVSMLG